MVVLYRDKHGRFISKQSAQRRKPENVLSEVRKTVTGKSLRIARGYHPRLRPSVKKKKIVIPPSLRPKPKLKPLVTPIASEEIEEEAEDFEEYEDIAPEDYEPEHPTREVELYSGDSEDIEDWLDFETGDDDFDKALLMLNDLDDIFDYPDEGDWYEET